MTRRKENLRKRLLFAIDAYCVTATSAGKYITSRESARGNVRKRNGLDV